LNITQQCEYADERLQNVDKYVNMLRGIFGHHVDSVTFDDFCSVLGQEDERLLAYISALGVGSADVEQLLYSLSRQASVDVDFEALTLGCINMVDAATKVDLLKLADMVEVVQARLESQTFAGGSTSSLLKSCRTTHTLQIVRVSIAQFEKALTSTAIVGGMLDEAERNQFKSTVLAAIKTICHCAGGCGIVVSLRAAFTAIQRQRVDFQVTDKNVKFPKGYMTERLNGVHVNDEEFKKAIVEFSEHTLKDRWPDDHPAAGLPKDGFTLLSHRGRRLKGAVKLVGLPMSPYNWDAVGMRHTTALGVCWALRLFPAVVLVRSDGGTLHGLYFSRGQVVALRCL